MNVKSHAQRMRGRLPDLSPFEGEEPRFPPIVTLSHPDGGHECDESSASEGGESIHGCVEWFRYPRRVHCGSRCGTP